MAYTTIDDPSAYFQTILFASKGAQTFDGNSDLQPDMIWNKNRDSAGYDHHIVDSVRGVSKLLRVNSTIAEFTSADSITSLNTDGFTIGNDANGYMQSGSDKIVTWGWKAGGSASSNSNGSITSSVSANTTAGFSIVSYTGTGSNATVGHGLGAVPKMIITKDRNNSNAWYVYHVGIGNTHGLRLSTTDAKEDDATLWNDTTPTSSVFSVGSNTGTNRSSNPIIAYCFAEKKGYSKFGSYTGNGNADGTFVYTGFKPAVLLYKNTSQSDEWFIHDNKRQGFNDDNEYLFASSSQAEGTANRIRFTSNGFKTLDSDKGVNASGNVYVYMAFAEAPFVTSTGIPTTAR